jgi:uncharacterized protein YlaI
MIANGVVAAMIKHTKRERENAIQATMRGHPCSRRVAEDGLRKDVGCNAISDYFCILYVRCYVQESYASLEDIFKGAVLANNPVHRLLCSRLFKGFDAPDRHK